MKTHEELKKELDDAWAAGTAASVALDAASVALGAAAAAWNSYAAARDTYAEKLKDIENEIRLS